MKNIHVINQHIYITSDEELKEGNWLLSKEGIIHNEWGYNFGDKKIILTTDADLDGVQAIDDDFLNWFVKNPSCEEVEVGYERIIFGKTDNERYWVSIPDKQFEMQQEEPKQETLEEVKDLNYWRNNAEEDYLQVPISVLRYISALEMQQERSYSEEEVIAIVEKSRATGLTAEFLILQLKEGEE